MGLGKAFTSVFHWFGLLAGSSTLYLSILLCCVTAASFCSQFNNPCELLSHFVFLYVALLAVICIVASVQNARWALAVALCALLVNVARFATYLVPLSTSPPLSGKSIRVLEFNCYGPRNKKPLEISKIARDEKADIICFCEVEGKWNKAIEANFPDYPYKKIFPFNCGIAVASKIPIEKSQTLIAEYEMRPRMLATFKLADGRTLSILLAHPTIPMRKDRFEGRNKEFELYVQDLAAIKGPRMIVGDLNCTPWSYYFGKLLQDSGLIDSEKGFGIQSSWPTVYKLPPFLPIDHFLVSPDIQVISRKIEREAGSDHRPVMIECNFPAAPKN